MCAYTLPRQLVRGYGPHLNQPPVAAPTRATMPDCRTVLAATDKHRECFEHNRISGFGHSMNGGFEYAEG